MSGGRGSRLILARIHCSLCNRLLHIRLGTGVMVPQVSELCEGIYHWKAYMGILGSNTFHTEATVHLLAPYTRIQSMRDHHSCRKGAERLQFRVRTIQIEPSAPSGLDEVRECVPVVLIQ